MCVMLLNARMLIGKIWQADALSEIVPCRHTEWPLEVTSGGMELVCCIVSLTLLACEHSCLFRLRIQTCSLTSYQIRNQFWAVFQKLSALKTITRSRDTCKATTIEPTISTIVWFSLPPWARPVECVRMGRAKLEVTTALVTSCARLGCHAEQVRGVWIFGLLILANIEEILCRKIFRSGVSSLGPGVWRYKNVVASADHWLLPIDVGAGCARFTTDTSLISHACLVPTQNLDIQIKLNLLEWIEMISALVFWRTTTARHW